MRITKQYTIGLIIDIQEKLFPVMYKKDELLDNCRILIQGLTELQLPLLVTQQYTKGLGETVEEIRSVVPFFSYVEKKEFSCCDKPEFKKKLNDLGAKNIIICGIEAHVCVLQTAIDLKDSGLNPVVVMDCVSSRIPESKELAKERFRHEGIIMTSAESVLFELTRSSALPKFKAISKLVK